MKDRRIPHPPRAKASALAVLVLALAALALPSSASAFSTPAIVTPTDSSVEGLAWNGSFTFSMSDTTAVTEYDLLRGTPNGGVCDSLALQFAATVATSTDPSATLLGNIPGTSAVYCYWVEATDGLAPLTSNPVEITFDGTAPTVSITSNPPSFTTSQSASFIFTVSDGTRQCQLDGGGFGPCGSSTTMAYSGLAEGPHTFTVQSTDAAQNVGSDTYSWTIDRTNPTVQITLNTKPSSLSNDTSVTFGFSSTEGTPDCKLDPGGVFGACSTATTMTYPTLSEGPHTFTVRFTDAAGNTGTDAYSWTVDHTPPSVPTSLTLVGPASRNTQPSFTFGTSTDAHGPLAYRLYRDGTFTGLTASTGSIADSTIAADGSNDGTYAYTVRAVDAAGNESASSGTVSVTMDSGPPSIPANVHALANPTRLVPVISWSASTGTPAAYQVLRNGVLIGTVNAPGSVFGDAAITADGTYTYTVRAVDNAGNMSIDSTSTKVIYDTTAPGAPAVTAAGAAGGTATLSWSAVSDGGSGVAGYQVRRSAADGAAPTSPADGTAACGPLGATALGCSDSGLTAGATYRYAVFATDAVGNVSAAGLTAGVLIPVSVDRTPPKAPSALHAAISGARVALSWKNPKADVSKVTVVWNARRAPRSASDGTAVYHGAGTHVDLKLDRLPPGKHLRFAVFALDRAGNVSTAARTTLSVPLASLLSLAPGGKLSGDPNLSWATVKGATYYNVQVFEGKQAKTRVGVAWPTGTTWTLPGADMQKGKTYTWYVWPGLGAKAAARYGKLIGKVTFTYTG
jgi:Bacterial Ig-like domain